MGLENSVGTALLCSYRFEYEKQLKGNKWASLSISQSARRSVDNEMKIKKKNLFRSKSPLTPPFY